MQAQISGARAGFILGVLGSVALTTSGPAKLLAQTATMSDAQVEANVIKALAEAPELSTQIVQSSTVYGVVTLSGSVSNEALRTRAENLVARAPGVKKVVDEMGLGGADAAPVMAVNEGAPDVSQADQTAPLDGSYAPGRTSSAPGQVPEGETARLPGASSPEQGQAPVSNLPPSPPNVSSEGQYPPPRYPAAAGPASRQPAPPYVYPGQQPAAAGAYGQPQPYPAPRGYAAQGGQMAGIGVVVPAGALLRVRVNRGLDSNHTQPGTPFDGTVLSDVLAGGAVAIPRGATVRGVVAEAHHAGALKGQGELALQLNSVVLGGTVYSLQTDVWEREGRDKTVRTVNSALGLGVLGAIVGGVTGGGAGAAIGAGVGAGAGVAGSAASPGGQVIVLPESVLSFHVAAPAAVRTVSEGEMQRLAYAAGPPPQPVYRPAMRRRYYPPYPYPYAPGPYPYPY